MNPKIEGHTLKEFLDAVERGKKLHPGPYSFCEEWLFDLREEWSEIWDAYAEAISSGKWGHFFDELMDLIVIGYRIIEIKNDILKELENEN